MIRTGTVAKGSKIGTRQFWKCVDARGVALMTALDTPCSAWRFGESEGLTMLPSDDYTPTDTRRNPARERDEATESEVARR